MSVRRSVAALKPELRLLAYRAAVLDSVAGGGDVDVSGGAEGRQGHQEDLVAGLVTALAQHRDAP
jgi:hypothetical protein